MLELAEGLVDAVVTYITANIGVKLTQINTRYSDGITLLNPAAIYNSEKSLEHVQGYPSIFVLIPTTRILRWSIDQLDAVHDLVVGVMVLEQDESKIRVTLYRYMLALVELLKESQSNAELGWHLATGTPTGNWSITFSPIFTQGDSYLADGQLFVTLTKVNAEVW